MSMRVISVAAILVALFALGVTSACAWSIFRGWEAGARHALHDTYYLVEATRHLIVFAVFTIIHLGAVFACFRFFRASSFGMASIWAFLGGLVAFSAGQFLTIWPIDFHEMPERYVDYTEIWESVRFVSQVASLLSLAGLVLFVAGWILLVVAMRRTATASATGRA